MGRRKFFVAVREMHLINCAEVHHLFFQNGGTMFNAPARRVTSSQQVTDIYIRHYQGVFAHVCKLLISPSLDSLTSLQPVNPTAPIVVDSSVYVAFAACAKFKLFFNSKLVLESMGVYAPIQPYYKLHGSYVLVSAGGIFSISLESCSDSNGFIGCIGPSICTGMNDILGWWCTRMPPEGWMLPTYRIEGENPAGGWVRAQSQGTITSRTKKVEPGLDNQAHWLWPNNVQSEVLHCRHAI